MFTKITEADLTGKGVIGQPAVPGLSTLEMQQSIEQVVREVAIPAINRLVDELAAAAAAQSVGAVCPESMGGGNTTVQGALEAFALWHQTHAQDTQNPHDVTAEQTGAYSREETDAAINQKIVEIGTGDMAKAVYDPDNDGKVVSALRADALGQAVQIGGALFDGSEDLSLEDIGAMAADVVLPLAQGGTGAVGAEAARQNLALSVCSKIVTTDSRGRFSIAGLLPGNNNPVFAVASVGGGTTAWIKLDDPAANKVSGIACKPDGSAVTSSNIRVNLIYGAEWQA